MTLWDWVLVALCAAGLLAGFAGMGAAGVAALALARRAAALQNAPVIASMASAPLIAERMKHAAAQGQALPARLTAAVEALKRAPSAGGLAGIGIAWAAFLREARGLSEELR